MTNGHNEPMTTVLIVDDEPIVRDVVARYLKRDGFDTLEAGDGNAARELIERSPPHLVVLDVMLPGTDGLSLCQWIRAARRPSGDHADRPRRGGRPDRRPRAGRRRLRHQALLAPRARDARAHRAPTEQPGRGFERSALFRRPRARCGDPRGASERGAAASDGEGVRPALLPRVEPAQRLLARPAHEPSLGLRSRASTRAPSPSTFAGSAPRSRLDPANPRRLETIWGVGYRFLP